MRIRIVVVLLMLALPVLADAQPAGKARIGIFGDKAAGALNITGTAVLQTELGPKGLELLHAAVPTATRIAVLWHQGTPSAVPGLKARLSVPDAGRAGAIGRRGVLGFASHGLC